jgi:threonine synthase
MPKFAVVQAEGASPFYDFMRAPRADAFVANPHPETLATAIKIGDPVSWPKAWAVLGAEGVVEKASEQEIADAKAVIGKCGIGCEPASAATLAGTKKLVASGKIAKGDCVVGVLTGHVLKDPDYIYRYHTGQLAGPQGEKLRSNFGNAPIVAANDFQAIAKLLDR